MFFTEIYWVALLTFTMRHRAYTLNWSSMNSERKRPERIALHFLLGYGRLQVFFLCIHTIVVFRDGSKRE